MFSDNPIAIDPSPAPMPHNLREKAATWTLGDDVSLLQQLQKLSTGILSEVVSLNNELKTVQKDASSVLSRVDKVSQAFNLLSSSQYVESRVYDDDDEETASKISMPVSNNSATKEGKEETMIPKLREAFEIGMGLLYQPTLANGNNSGQAFDPISDYNSRPLPYLVGTAEFFQHPVPGLRSFYENNNTEKGKMEESERKKEKDEEELSTSTSTSVCCDSDDDTASRPLADVPGVHVQVPNVPTPGFEPSVTSVLPGRVSPSVEEESDDFEGNSILDTQHLPVSKEKKPSAGLFDDDSNPESDEDLFHSKPIVNKSILLANGKVLHGGVSVFGPQPPKIVPPSVEPSLSQTKPIIPNISTSEPVNAPQISKPKPKSLFDDDEEDLFAPIVARNQAPPLKTPASSSTAPKLSDSTISATTSVSSKSVVNQISRNPELKKQQSLFGDSDSEDDLFAPVKSAKPASQSSLPKGTATSQVSAAAPPKIADLSSKAKIFTEDDEDDLFAPVKPSNVVSQNNSKSTEISQIPAVAPEAPRVGELGSKKNILNEDDLFAPKFSVEAQSSSKSTPTSQASVPEAQKTAETGSKSEILYESDEDDLFSTKPTMPKPGKLRVKNALSTAVTPAAVQPVFEAKIDANGSKKPRSRSVSPRSTAKSSVFAKNGSPKVTLPPSKKLTAPNNLFDASDSDDDLFAGVSTTKSMLAPKILPALAPEKIEKESTTPQIPSGSPLEENKTESVAQENEAASKTLSQTTTAIPENTTNAPEIIENSAKPKAPQTSTNLFSSDDEDDLFAGNRSQATKIESGVGTERTQVITTVCPPTPPQVPPPDDTGVTKSLDQIPTNMAVSPKSPISGHSTLNSSISSNQKEHDSSQNTSGDDSQYSGLSSGRGSSISPSSFVSPLNPGGNSDSDASSGVKSARKPVGGVALFGGALLLGGKMKPSSRESPSSTPSVFSGELPPVFTPSPVSSGPSFEGPSSIGGPSPDVLPTLVKARAKIAAKRKPPSKRFRQQGLPTEDITGDSVTPYQRQATIEGPETAATLESAVGSAIPESTMLPESKSPLGSDSASLPSEIKEDDSGIPETPEKPRKIEITDSARPHYSDEVFLKGSSALDSDSRLESPLKFNEIVTSNDSRESKESSDSSKKPAPSKLASLFDSDDEEDLFAPKPLPARKTDYTKPVSQNVENDGPKRNLEHNVLASSSKERAFLADDEESEDDLFGTTSGLKKTEFSQKTPHESETSNQPWKDVQEKPSKPKVSAALFNDDDSDEDLFSTKPNPKFPPRNTMAFTAPKKEPAPFKDPLLGSP